MDETKIYRQTFATINIKNLKHNIRTLKKLSNDLFFCPMVKSNAYGHGDKKVVEALISEGVQNIGVALIEEAIRIRNYGFSDINILIFGAIKEDAFSEIIKYKLTPVLTNWTELEKFSNLNIKNHPIHIKFNTGMNRLGFKIEDSEKVSQFIKNNVQLSLQGICSHFQNGENINIEGESSEQQLELFNKLVKSFSGITQHLYNSSSFLNSIHKKIQFNGIGSRLGLAIYGCYPSSNYKKNNFPLLKPVMSLQSEVIEYQKIKVGEKVSYDGLWEAKRPSIIGIIPIGYTDGYGIEFSNKGKMIFRKQLVNVVGKICMDYTMVDLTDVLVDEVGKIGEEIVLFGEKDNLFYGVEEFSEEVNKIPYETLTTLGRRVPRKYI